MSVKLIKTFSNALKYNLPKLPCPKVIPRPQVRFLTAMETQVKTDEHEIVSSKKFTRFKRRQWEVTKDKEEGETDAKKVCDGEKTERIKRKKVAMLLGYSGVDYYGMQSTGDLIHVLVFGNQVIMASRLVTFLQDGKLLITLPNFRNPGVRTIEEDLLEALLKAKYITEDDFKNQQNAQFQRSSRTDKGVSAARQVVSLKLPLEANVEEINKHLPECIRVFGIKRVTNKFNSKIMCNARSYSYTLPTYVFEPSLTGLDERRKYRMSAEKLEKINSILSIYKGTKPYHNFTEKKYFHDPSASRFMMDFGVEKTFVNHDMEFAVLIVKGQSFMLHQIRKMVGLVIAVVRGHTDYSTMEKAFGKEKVMIPTAPGLGLVLDMVHYDRYDAKHKGTHDSLSWEEYDVIVQKFKHEHVYPIIVKGEIEDNNMALWLEQKLAPHSYEPNEENDNDKCEKEMDDDDDEGAIETSDEVTKETDEIVEGIENVSKEETVDEKVDSENVSKVVMDSDKVV